MQAQRATPANRSPPSRRAIDFERAVRWSPAESRWDSLPPVSGAGAAASGPPGRGAAFPATSLAARPGSAGNRRQQACQGKWTTQVQQRKREPHAGGVSEQKRTSSSRPSITAHYAPEYISAKKPLTLTEAGKRDLFTQDWLQHTQTPVASDRDLKSPATMRNGFPLPAKPDKGQLVPAHARQVWS